MGKGVQTRLVKPTETADLNNGELLVPRLISGIPARDDPDAKNIGFDEETSEICRNSCSGSVFIAGICVDL